MGHLYLLNRSLQSRRLTIKPRHPLRVGLVVCDRLYFVGTPGISWNPQTYKKYLGDPPKKEKEGRKKTHEAKGRDVRGMCKEEY